MKFSCDKSYFDPLMTLDCGQVFRFKPYKEGFLVISGDKIAYVYSDDKKTYVESEYPDYFYNYFDCDRDYKKIVEAATLFDIPYLTKCALASKGLRILNQQREETIYSFIISQNNNIPRIKGIIEKICLSLGEKLSSPFGEYYSFPSSLTLAQAPVEVLKSAGAGYRDEYIHETAKILCNIDLKEFDNLTTQQLRERLLQFKGIGAKVADCALLFAFRRTDSFPVDTWIEKVYRDDLGGTLFDRVKISKYLTDKFGQNSGYVQQYLFYGKRLNL